MKISLIIPHYPIHPELDDKLKKCLDSLAIDCEKVIVVNLGLGFAKSVNYGLKAATGDYLMVVNNDIEWLSGNILDLCKEGAVTSPKVNGEVQPFWGCFFCLPRAIYERIGGLDEQFEMGYSEDDDYVKRLQVASVPMECITSCEIKTAGAGTMRYLDRVALVKINKEKYDKKWS